MNSTDYLKYITDEIHTVIVATVDDEGHPITAAIDMMDSDESGLYFLTARGKSFYDRLIKRQYLAFTALKGETTMTSVAVSVRGKVRELGADRITELFGKNPYMYEIYPTEESRKALTVFHIYEGTGEWFDLSKKPIERDTFRFGASDEVQQTQEGYFITDACIGCGSCLEVCPQKCISPAGVPYIIEQNHCLRCGNCLEICPADAVIRK